MKRTGCHIFIILLGIALSVLCQAQSLPHLAKKGSATQLIVHDKPFLILGGELGNSSASDLKYMADMAKNKPDEPEHLAYTGILGTTEAKRRRL